MPLIERINQMQKQGLDDEEIIRRLQDEGVSPREINEALDQIKVKSAISENEWGMEPSVMTATEDNLPIPVPETRMQRPLTQEIQPFQQLIPSTQMLTEVPQKFAPHMRLQETEAPQQFAPPMRLQETEEYGYPSYQYPEYEYQAAAAPIDTEIITEIAEQITNEKLQKIEKQILEATAFKTETVGKIGNIDERLKRIEMIIDRLQASILGKIGDYGKDISELKDEMQATQESFSKILNPLTENIEELRKITGSTKTKAQIKKVKGKSKKDNFENYLRE